MLIRRHSGRRFFLASRFILALIAGRLGLAIIATFSAGAVFAFIAHQIREGDTVNIDHPVIAYFRQPGLLPLRQIAGIYTHLGDGPTVGIVTLIAFLFFVWRKRLWPDGWAILTAGAGGFLLIEGLKAIFGRPRPEGALAAGLSFPSGHSFLGIAVYGFLLNRLGIKARWWIFPCLAIGATRPVLGVHYPTDVLAGWVAGGAWLTGCLAFPRTFHRGNFVQWQEQRGLEWLRAKRELIRLRKRAPELRQAAGKWGERIPARWGRRIEGELLLLALLARARGNLDIAPEVLHWEKRLFGIVRD